MKLNISRKILAVGLGVVLVGALGLAVVNASSGTSARNGERTAVGTEFHGGGHGQGSAQSPTDHQGYSRGQDNAQEHVTAGGPGNSQGRRTGSGRSNGQSGQGQGRSSSSGKSHSLPAREWTTVSGQVLSLADNKLTVQTVTGKIEIGLGPIWYWDANRINLNPGDEVTVKGFHTDEFEPGRVTNESTGDSVTLRSDDGTPLWAGR